MTRFRRCLALLIAVAAFAAVVGPVASSGAAPTTASAAAAKPKPRRLGGKVRRAWPARGARRPKTALARWLARQVGPRRPIACARRPKRARARCRARLRPRGDASVAAAGAPVARAASAAMRGSTEQIRIAGASGTASLQLIRSFAIPSDDPSYDRLLNWSWTYDSAVSAVGFASDGAQAQSGRLLDQLAALQRKDGAIEFAFDLSTGNSSRLVRAGSIAMSGIAWVDFTDQFNDRRYLDNAKLAANYLLDLRNGDGLVRGGPDVKWVSTQHNLLAGIFLMNLSQRLEKDGERAAAARYQEAADVIAKGIDSQLIVRDDGPLHFRQGVEDNVIPLDTQTIGAIWSAMRGDMDTARQTYEFAQKYFRLDGRSIERSKEPATYNMTYEARGPFTGYRPYLGKEAPNVLWFEGTAQMRFVSSAPLGEPSNQLDESMKEWWSITRSDGLAPLGADRTITRSRYNEYHVWPTAAAGAWTLISGASQNADWADPPEG